MLQRAFVAIAGLWMSVSFADALEERFAALRVGWQVYSNVTVIGVTPTHLTFSHYRGVTTAKLADLDPVMQQHFHFDPQIATALQGQHERDDMLYRQAAIKGAAGPAGGSSGSRSGTNAWPLLAKPFLNQPAPELCVETWIGDPPDTKGKFVLVDFWATWCPPCRRAIPHLNEVYAKYKDRLVVIGLSSESEQQIVRMTQPQIDYALASDTQGRTSKALEIHGIPHLMLIDPKGIVRFQGLPQALPDEVLEDLLARHSPPVEEKRSEPLAPSQE